MKRDCSTNTRFLKSFLKPFYPLLIAGSIVMLITDACQLYVPRIISNTINHIDSLVKGQQGSDKLSWHYLILYMSVIIILFLSRHYWRVLTISGARKMGAEMKQAFFEHLLSLSQENLDDMKTGDLMSRLSSDISAIERMVAFAFVVALDTLVHLLVIFVILFHLNSTLFYYVLPVMVLGPIVFQVVRRKLYASTLRYQALTARLATVAEESFSCISVIKSFANEKVHQDDFSKVSDDMAKQRVKIVFWESFLAPLANLLMGMAVALIFYKASTLLTGPNPTLTFKDLIEFVLYLMMIEWPIRAVGMVIGMMQKGTASLERLRTIFSFKAEAQTKRSQTAAGLEDLSQADLEFRHLNFSYRETQVLFDISVTIPKGCHVALIGHVGSGKTSFLSLIPQLYAADKGQIFWKGEDILNLNLEALRRRIGFVGQEAFLFSHSIKDNVLFGLEDKDLEDTKVKAWLEASQILQDVKVLPDSLESMLGERGVNLSGGQQQRLTIARALAVNPDIYIFDDCFSALDASTEERLMKALTQFCAGKTTITASHRMSTVQNCDLILVFEEGRIVEQGSPAELRANKESYYHKMLSIQAESWRP